jgi:hypothetical protein
MIEEDMTPADELRAAADFLMTNGWIQHKFNEGYDGPSCALGAVGAVPGGGLAAENLLRKFLFNNGFARFSDGTVDCLSIGAWNDAPGRTVDEVVHAMLSAAQMYDEGLLD